MAEYKVTITTGEMMWGGTFDNVFITLVGTEGESERTMLNEGRDFAGNSGKEYIVKCESALGKIILIGIEKEPYLFLPDDDWFCAKVKVITPEKEELHFPCYRWIKERHLVFIREGKALTPFKEEDDKLILMRQAELETQKKAYQWKEFIEKLPYCIAADDAKELPPDLQFTFDRSMEFLLNFYVTMAELKCKFLADSKKPWANLSDISGVFWFNKTETFTYVQEHWKEDPFFGYQFLNGANPMVIQCCKKLPETFPVTEDMVQSSLKGSALALEMMNGNIFLCDYKLLLDLPTNVINMRPQHVVAPICLFHRTAEDKIVPIAIQLRQEPGELSPIFLPSDSEEDWLLAKVYVRAADFIEHQLHYHLLRTHLLAEAYCLATLRNLPTVHPVYKLLIPHTRFTVHINLQWREKIMSKDGFFPKYTATGSDGMVEALKRAYPTVTYRSLCLPENIEDRGLKDVPNFYYRDDGLALWDILFKYVDGVMRFFYKSDAEVALDKELQDWILDIFTHGFLKNAESGIPQAFQSVDKAVKFLTMVIFNMTAQHSAVNSGQV
ncbi:hydroperoxide isomerase ALOXE3-like [Chanos chanos]|uniref:Hydroperoxide isomerase ALOXE3-like n=1 Tax=Chanos chanos TaxID=29144 RepID=A0A6J2VD98_CHACN|nr:hydroperoxide isomerase ALOXE3-like [Chanos chanos]